MALMLVSLPAAAQVVSASDAARISAAASAASRASAAKLFADGFRLLQASQFQAAAVLYGNGLALDPANAQARYYFGLVQAGLGNAAAARTQYELVVALAPHSEAGAIAQGILLELDEERSATVDGCW